MKKELLAPAGSMECLKAAVKAGADAVYLSGKLFGARKYATNFSNDELEEAVKYCHLVDVKIYVTVNTIIYESEIDMVLEYLTFLDNIGVDAVIVQDIGLMVLIRKYLPNLEIHASTQAHTHNIEQIKFLESLGVKRVVLSRELSLEDINRVDAKVELEVFIHGALCISYSGQCLFSSGVLNRSGNRGECAGLCRTPFNLWENNKKIIDNKYLISPKELNTTDDFEKLKNSKIVSFKIEGRMKSPEYVGYVTSIYRKLIDNTNYKLSEEEIFNLKSLYNRGFTKGYLFNTEDKDLISLNSSNHLGVEVGEVIDTKDKIKILLKHDIRQGDAVRFSNGEGMFINFLYDHKLKLINKAFKGDIIYLDNKVNLKSKGKLYLTINSKLSSDLKKLNDKKIDIKCEIYAHINEELTIRYSDGKNIVEYKGEVVNKAINSPLKEERIEEIFRKIGDAPFNVLVDIDMDDNIFIVVGYLKEIRRSLIEQLIKKRLYKEKKREIDFKRDKKIKKINNNYKISALVRNEEQLKALLNLDVDIYVTSIELYNKYKNKNVYLRLNRVMNKFEDYKEKNILIGETGSLKYLKDNKINTDYYLNVVNSSYLEYLINLGVKRVCLSPELSFERLELLLDNYNGEGEIEYIVYGTLEYMIMKYNLIKDRNLNKEHDYYLEDKAKRKFKVFNDGYTHLMSDKKIDYLNDIKYLKKIGINVFRLEFDQENKDQVIKIVNKLKTFL